jgi:hypothetical protein
MIRFTRIGVLAFVLVAGLLVFAACGGDDDDNGGEPTATEAADGGVTPDDSSSDGGTDLDELLASGEQVEVKVAYDFSGAGLDGTMTLYSKPPSQSRVDFSGADGDFIIISTAENTYLCTEGSCIASPAGASSIPVPFLSFLTSPDGLQTLVGQSLGDVDVDQSSDTIAGEDATCFTASGTVEGETGSGTFCFADDGIMLRMDASSAEGDFALNATSVDRSVSDSDFEPPFPVEEIPGIP